MDLHELLIGDQRWSFLLETVVRTTLMFFLVLALFMLTGKKEVRQFSVLEVILIIGLGSALGDPMFQHDIPLLPALLSIAAVLLLYRLMNLWTNRYPRVGRLVEGRVRTLVHNGRIDHAALRAEGMSVDELLGDLRVHHVEHLGQVKAAHLEIDGELSVYFHASEEVRPGLPISPDREEQELSGPTSLTGHVSCLHCGHTLPALQQQGSCMYCGDRKWVPSLSIRRVG